MTKERTISDGGAKALAGAVLMQAAKDIHAQSHAQYRSAERDVENGGCDLYLDLIGLDIDHDTFIKQARRRGK